eukprot:5141967-Pyramimonas_sp.AAC.1
MAEGGAPLPPRMGMELPTVEPLGVRPGQRREPSEGRGWNSNCEEAVVGNRDWQHDGPRRPPRRRSL